MANLNNNNDNKKDNPISNKINEAEQHIEKKVQETKEFLKDAIENPKETAEEFAKQATKDVTSYSWWAKLLLVLFWTILSLFAIGFIAINLPVTKNWLTKKVVNKLNQDLNTQIAFEKIDLNYFGDVTLHKVTVKDHRGYHFIKAKELYADSDWFSILANSRHIKFQSLSIKNLDMKVITYKGDSIPNFIRFVELFDNGKKPDPNRPPFQLKTRIIIKDSKLSIVNQNHTGDAGRWLDAENLNLIIPELKVKGPEVSAKVNQLRMTTKRWGKKHFLDTFSTDFSLTKEALFLDDLLINTNHSLLHGSLKFNLNNGTWADFGNKVKWDMQLKKGSQISGYDISYFVKDWDNYKPINTSGNMTGVLNNFTLNQFSIGDNDSKIVSSSIKVAKILDKSFSVETNSISTDLTYKGLKSLFPSFISKKMGNVADDFGRIKYNGMLKANPEQITLRGNLISGVGQAKIDRFTLREYSKVPKYNGLLEVTNLNVATITKNPQVGLISGRFDLDGESFDINQMKLRTKSNIRRIELLDKTLNNLVLDGYLNKKRYEGIVNINDENAQANVKGIFDFSTPRLYANVTADINHLNASYFSGSSERQIISGYVDTEVFMKDINDMQLNAHLRDVKVLSKDQKIALPTGDVKAYFEDGKRIVSVNAPNVVEGKVAGKFNLGDIGGMVQNSISKLLVTNQPKRLYRGQYLDLDFKISQGLINFFEPNLRVSNILSVSGSYDGNSNDLLLNADTSYLKYIIGKKETEKVNQILAETDVKYNIKSPAKKDSIMIDGLALKIDTKSREDNFSLEMNRAEYNKNILKNASIIGKNPDGEHLHLAIRFLHGTDKDEKEDAMKSYAVNLNQTTNVNGDYIIRFEPTEVKLNSFVWNVDTSPELNHSITYRKKTGFIDIENLKFYSDDSEVLVNGTYKDAKNINANIDVKNVNLSKVLALKEGSSDLNIKGNANGTIKLAILKNNIEPIVDLKVDGFSIHDKNLGDLLINAEKTERPNIFDVDLKVTSSDIFGNDKLRIFGKVDNNTPSPSLDLTADLNKFDLAFVQEFVKAVFSNFRGNASGQLKINGTVDNINYNGDIALSKFGFKLNFSGVDYYFDDTVIPLSKGFAVLNNIGISDGRNNSKGSVSGAIQFDDIASMGLNLIIRTDNLMLLNTTQRDFDVFWGRVYGTGDIFVDGAVTALNINAKTKVLNNSVFTLNSNSATSVDEFKMLRFVERNEDGVLSVSKREKSGANMNIELALDVDRGSTVNVLVGDDIGDISVRGTAENLRFRMNRSGQMSMNGTYVVDNGTYVSKAVLERSFQIAKGSSISWDNNVMNPALNISANYYRTVTNLGEYLNTGKLPPVNVMLETKITQSLSNPDIQFDIKTPDVSSQIKEALAFRMSTPDEKIIQFGSILALNNFNVANTGGLTFDVGSTVTSQGYALLMKQLGAVLNTISNQFQIDLDYIRGDQATNTADRASGRLSFILSPRVNIKTGLGVPIARNQNAEANNFLSGEGIIEYDWSKSNDGSRILRAYSKPSNISNIVGQNAGANQSWGGGVVYSKSFNRFFSRKKKDSFKAKETTDSTKTK
ncbi:translocation/assembly module TamB domain-containing protein [Riemerella anatipestifer]|uniref:translocation/assembly module TamB domain-containing protein n=1 Tax=Riemerella anatipestifer TaxID=34085 RepID=UPI0021F8ED49|nr:translocation/assembly module TamB [Riemerella anatipestifer]MCW0488978.1 translocation/assembly module TamB [Riemerella anatipestifer]